MRKISIILIIIFYTFTLYSAKVTLKVFDDSRLGFSLESAADINMGTVIAGGSSYSGRIIVKNTGQTPIWYALKVRVTGSSLKPVEKNPGVDQFRLFGLFHKWDSPPLKSDYLEDDIILKEYGYASTNIYAKLRFADVFKGIEVPRFEDRNLFLRFDAPPSITVEPSILQMKIYILGYVLESHEEPHKKPDEKIFTPNGDGINDRIVFHGLSDLLKEGKVTINILDVRGRKIKTIKHVEYWDGMNEDGEQCKGGVYLYQYKYADKYVTGVIVIAK